MDIRDREHDNWMNYLLLDWYASCEFVELIQDSIASRIHTNFKSLSRDWIPGELLWADDVGLVLCNAQAYNARDGLLRFLTCHVQRAEDVAFKLLNSGTEDFVFIGRCLSLEMPLFIPFHEGNHFRALIILPSQKAMFMFDSLCMPSSVLSNIAGTCAQFDYSFVPLLSEPIQRDGWTCGLWCILLHFAFQEFLSSGNIDFQRWISENFISPMSMLSFDVSKKMFPHILGHIRQTYDSGQNVFLDLSNIYLLAEPAQSYNEQGGDFSSKKIKQMEILKGLFFDFKGSSDISGKASYRKFIAFVQSSELAGFFKDMQIQNAWYRFKAEFESKGCQFGLEVKQHCPHEVVDEEKPTVPGNVQDFLPVPITNSSPPVCVQNLTHHLSGLLPTNSNPLHPFPLTPVPGSTRPIKSFKEALLGPSQHSLNPFIHSYREEVPDMLVCSPPKKAVYSVELNNSTKHSLLRPSSPANWQPCQGSKLQLLKDFVFKFVEEKGGEHRLNGRMVLERVRKNAEFNKYSDKQVKDTWHRMRRSFQAKHRSILTPTGLKTSHNQYEALQDIGNKEEIMQDGKRKRPVEVTQKAHHTVPEATPPKIPDWRPIDSHIRYTGNLLSNAGFVNGHRKYNSLAMQFMANDTRLGKLGYNRRYNLLSQWHGSNEFLDVEYAKPSLGFSEYPDLHTVREPNYIQCTLRIYETMQNKCSLPGLYSAILELSNVKVLPNKSWSPSLNRHFIELFSPLELLDKTDSIYMESLKHDKRFEGLSDSFLRAKLQVLRDVKASAFSGHYKTSGLWSQVDESNYRLAYSRSKVNLSRGNLRQWAELISFHMNVAVSMQDIYRRLLKQWQEERLMEGFDFSKCVPAEEDHADSDSEEEDGQFIVRSSERVDLVQASVKFSKDKCEGPTQRCGCCGQLSFKSSMRFFSDGRHATLYDFPDIQETLAYLLQFPSHHDIRLICSSCDSSFTKKCRPTFCFGETLPHVRIPPIVSDLNDLEADLCAPQVAFCKIVNVQWQKQKKLVGAIINVPADYISSVQALPRTDIQDLRIMVDLKRRIEYKGSYKLGLVRPFEVRQACMLLCKTPLYKENDVKVLNTMDTAFYKSGETMLQPPSEDNSVFDESPGLEVVTIKKENNENPKVEKHNDGDASKYNKSHTSQEGIDIVSDDEDLYEDETNINEEKPCCQTFVNTENDAGELRRSCMRLAPAEGNHPQGILRNPHGEELCFPRLFAGQARKGYGNTAYYMIARHELRSADRKFASDPQNIFFKMRKNHCQTVCGIANMSVRRSIRGAVTAGQLLSPIGREDLCQHDLGYLSLNKLRTSPDYKVDVKRDIFAMIKQLGKPCWFVTLTCGDSRWTELTSMLFELKYCRSASAQELDNLTSADRAKLISEDPVTCARYFHRRASKYIKDIIMKTKVLGSLIEHAGVDEFTTMGNPHVHLLFWSDDAPVYGQSSDAEVTSFIDNYLTTDLDKVSPDLGNVQRHTHKKRCGGRVRACSFGFPKPPMAKTMILRPLEDIGSQEHICKRGDYSKILNALRLVNIAMKEAHKAGTDCPSADLSFDQFLKSLSLSRDQYYEALRSSIQRPTVFHRRKLKHLMVNAFNRDVLVTWDANIDIQYILNPWAATMYIASYISKSSKGLTTLLRSIQQGTYVNSAAKIRATGSAWINTSEISSQEAVYHVLSLSFRRFSNEVLFVNTNPPEKQHLIAKHKKDLEKLDSNDTDCFKESQQEKYSKRKAMKEVCMADYFSKYGWCRKESAQGQVMYIPKLRAKKRILRFPPCDRFADREAYCRQHVMLYYPWTGDFDSLIFGNLTWSEFYTLHEQVIIANESAYCTVSDEEWADICKEIQEAIDDMEGGEKCPEGDVFGDRLANDKDGQEGQDGEPRKHAIVAKQNTSRFLSDDAFNVTMKSLNGRQHEFFQYVMKLIRSGSTERLNVFLTGGAGVGKSMLALVLIQAVTKHYNYDHTVAHDTLRIILLAPTGKAAFNIGGMTVHSGLAILPDQVNKPFTELASSRLSVLQAKYQHLRMMIVDEVSMLGTRLLNRINARLKQIMNVPDVFGGLHVLFVGDLFQLRPVMASWIFQAECALTEVLWRRTKMYELTEIMRQKEDKKFAELLNRLRCGETTQEDYKRIATRFLATNMGVPYLFTTHVSKDAHNLKVLQLCKGHDLTFHARDVLAFPVKCQDIKNQEMHKIFQLKTHETGGLPLCLKLKEGLSVELTANLDVNDGLCNGTDGEFKQHTFVGNQDILWIKFFSPIIGLQRRADPLYRNLATSLNIDPSWTPVKKIMKEIMFKRRKGASLLKQFSRRQFPIVLAAARTVHHAQGSTFETGGIDFVPRPETNKPYLQPGIHYVALSRYKHLDKVFLGNFDLSEAEVDSDVVQEDDRMRREACLQIEAPLFQAESPQLLMYVHNVRSFGRYADYMKLLPSFQAASVMFLVETCCHVTHHAEYQNVADLQCIEIPGCNSRPRGIAFLSRPNVTMSELGRLQIEPSCPLLEAIAVSVQYEGNSLDIVGLYRSPKAPLGEFLSCLDSFLQALPRMIQVIVGDFNIDLHDPDHRHTGQLAGFMMNHGLYNLQTSATRIAGTAQSRIDHVWLEEGFRCSVEVGTTYFSDHEPILCYFDKALSAFEPVQGNLAALTGRDIWQPSQPDDDLKHAPLPPMSKRTRLSSGRLEANQSFPDTEKQLHRSNAICPVYEPRKLSRHESTSSTESDRHLDSSPEIFWKSDEEDSGSDDMAERHMQEALLAADRPDCGIVPLELEMLIPPRPKAQGWRTRKRPIMRLGVHKTALKGKALLDTQNKFPRKDTQHKLPRKKILPVQIRDTGVHATETKVLATAPGVPKCADQHPVVMPENSSGLTEKHWQLYNDSVDDTEDPDVELFLHRESNIGISRKIMKCLRPRGWLNDEVMNMTMALLLERDRNWRQQNVQKPRCHFFKTFFFNHLYLKPVKKCYTCNSERAKERVKFLIYYRDKARYDYAAVRKWTLPRRLQPTAQMSRCILDCQKIIAPVHLGSHWTLIVVDLECKELVYYDSMLGERPDIMECMATYIRDEFIDKKGIMMHIANWTQRCETSIPIQTNGCDCGMFALAFASHVSKDSLPRFTQQNMDYLRVLLAASIMQQELSIDF